MTSKNHVVAATAQNVIARVLMRWCVASPQDGASILIEQLEAAGYAVVPVEPTKAMVEAGHLDGWDLGVAPRVITLEKVWRAMVEARRGDDRRYG